MTNPSLLSPLQIRHIISDFAVFIAVVVWVVVDILAMVDTPKLDVPNVFEHGVYTDSSRNGSFIINPLGLYVCMRERVRACVCLMCTCVLLVTG